MQKINTLEELKELSFGEKFYIINNAGEISQYLFSSINPKSDKIVVAITDANYTTSVCFTDSDFTYGKKVFVKGKYVSEEVGEIMIDQLNKRILSIQETYLQSTLKSN